MKSLMVKLSGIGVILSFHADVWGAGWKYIEEAYAGKYLYDAESMRPSKDIARVWTKVIYTEKGVNYMVSLRDGRYRTLSHAIFLFEFHCGDKKKCVLPIACYSKDGKVLISADDQNFNLNFICPDSIDEALGKILCK